jgi:ABC-type transport system substrate-binding protein
VEVDFVPDPTTAIQLLAQGVLDAVAPMPGVSWGRRLDAVPGVTVSEALGPDLVYLVLRTDAVPEVEVRRGIVDAIDRDRLVDAVLRGEAAAADGVVAPQQPEALPAWAGYGEDPPPSVATADELDLVYVRAELTDIVARYLQAELDRAGVDVELVPLDSDVFHGIFLPERRFDLALVERRTGSSPELWPWVEVDGAAEPLTGLADAGLAGLAAAVASGDAGALGRAQRRLAELAPVLPLFQPQVTVGWREGVQGLQANPTADGPLWNAWAWTVPAK